MVVANTTFIITSAVIIIITGITVGFSVWHLKPDKKIENDSGGYPKENSTSNDGGRIIPNDFQYGLIVRTESGEIKAFNPNKNTSTLLADAPSKDFFNYFDYYKSNTIYYSLAVGGSVVSLSKEYPKIKVPDNRWNVKALAVDFRYKNVYIYDDLAHIIYLFDMQGKYYGIVLADLELLIDIAVDPYRDYIFMLLETSILMAVTDGTQVQQIVTDKAISAFTVDVKSGNVYWSKPGIIMSYDYIVHKSLKVATTPDSVKVVNLAVLRNELYYTAFNGTLHRCRLSKGICTSKAKEVPSENLLQIKAYDLYGLPSITNPCDDYNGGCEHLCIGSPIEIAKSCACNLGWQLTSNLRSCSPIDEYILYARDFSVRGRIADLSTEGFTDAILPKYLEGISVWRKRTVHFDYNAHKGYAIFSDDKDLIRFDLNGKARQMMLQSDHTFSMYPAIDWVSDNLYYIAAHRLGNTSYLMVRHTYSYSDFVIQKTIHTFSKDQYPRAIVVHPNLGYVFFTVYDDIMKKGVIYRINSDGSSLTVFGNGNEDISINETSLAIDYIEGRLYWFNADRKKIQHTALDGSDLRSFDSSFLIAPDSINIHREWIYIGNSTTVFRVVKKTGEFPLQFLPSHTEDRIRFMSAVKGYSASLQPMSNSHPCAVENGGCKRYCFAVPINQSQSDLKRVCGCNDNEKLNSDGKSCDRKPKEESN